MREPRKHCLDKEAQNSSKHTSILPKKMKEKGILNGCVLLADKHTGQYRAMVGGFDFWDNHH